ncbi:MAG: hypothetical protein ACLFTV_16710, partial [Desulfococcaceae bacterium]
ILFPWGLSSGSWSWAGWNAHRVEMVQPEALPWVFIQSPIGKNQSTGQVTEISVSDWESSEFVPRTKLGMKLLEIRKKAIAEGIELLGDDEVLEEIRRRRGEF